MSTKQLPINIHIWMHTENVTYFVVKVKQIDDFAVLADICTL